MTHKLRWFSRVADLDQEACQGASLGVPLVTEDRKLCRAAPAVTHSLVDALGIRE